jgi:hypothetical protein
MGETETHTLAFDETWTAQKTMNPIILRYFVYYLPSCLFFETQRFGDWILSPSSGKITQFGPIDGASPYLRKMGYVPFLW